MITTSLFATNERPTATTTLLARTTPMATITATTITTTIMTTITIMTTTTAATAATAAAAATATTDGSAKGIRVNYGKAFNRRTAIGVMHEPRGDNESKLN
jgi:hypothetical protein